MFSKLRRLFRKIDNNGHSYKSDKWTIPDGYGVKDDGPIPIDSDLHRHYLVATYPDPYITQPDNYRRFSDIWQKRMKLDYPWYDPLRMLQLLTFLEIANKLPDGDYAEFGVGGGAISKVIYGAMNEVSTLLCFDTFEGFAEEDVKIENEMFSRNIDVSMLSGSSIDAVRKCIIADDNSESKRLEIVKGRLPSSFEQYLDRRFRFVHIDLDLYEPTRAMVEILYDQVLPGGVMMFHDYGCSLFPGVKRAVDEYFAKRGILVVPLSDKLVTAVVIKQRLAG
jgi:hypothetical protein